ncbi:MAG: exodeoxyribonuclease III [Deltaproteobacteria bacterium]|jgi:exodeoxyribonuclease-3|nr:exodeoxyribonuclease III [Deltaproteobacteria bacterium]
MLLISEYYHLEDLLPKMILYSWNVNGIRAVSKKPDFFLWLQGSQAHLVALQETKAHPSQLDPHLLNPLNYLSYWASSQTRKGYSGVVTYSLEEPQTVTLELPELFLAKEGRLILTEYPDFYFFNVYFPNGQKDDERLAYKLDYYNAFLDYAEKLRKLKPIVVCGDFNTAHKPIDLSHPKENEDTSGFLPIERAWLDKFISHGYIDTFRYKNGDITQNYTWWSFRTGARSNNVGWRIDYFFVSQELAPRIKRAWIEPHIFGSDHCPVGLELSD